MLFARASVKAFVALNVNILVIDIAEQSEIIDFTKQAITGLSKKYPKLNLNLLSFQLNSKHLESDFDFTPVEINDQIHLALFHTKVFKTAQGQFLDPSWWIQFVQSVFRESKIHLNLYSGDIAEFKQWYEVLKLNHNFEPHTLNLLDVFDLLYPPEVESFEVWFELQVINALKSLKSGE